MGKLFVIMGKSAAGKDSLYKRLMEQNAELKEIVSYTTRPIREGETEGKEYHFVTEQQMEELREQGRIAECRKYDTVRGPWYYFTADDGQIDFESGDSYVLISTLEGYEKLRLFYGKDNIVPIYIEVDDFERLERAVKRERQQKSPCVAELCRRFLADEEDFSEERLRAAEVSNRIINNDLEQALKQMEKLIGDLVKVGLE